MKKPSRRFIWFAIIVIGLVTITFQYSKSHPNQVSLFPSTQLTQVPMEKEWESFRKQLNLSKKQTKIQNIELIVNRKNQLYSMTFDLIDTKDEETFTIYHYEECLACDGPLSQTLKIDKSRTHSVPPEYGSLISARAFFSQLEKATHTSFLKNDTYSYHLLYSSGWYESNSKGIRLLRVGNDQPEDFQTKPRNTKTILFTKHL